MINNKIDPENNFEFHFFATMHMPTCRIFFWLWSDMDIGSDGSISRSLHLLSNHGETISFFNHQFTLVTKYFGWLWLCKQNLQIDCTWGKIRKCSQTCQSSFLLPPVLIPLEPFPEFPDHSVVLECYLNLKEVFNNTQAAFLLMGALPRTAPPEEHLYSLSGPERQGMDEYTQGMVAMGIISPSYSSAGGWVSSLLRKKWQNPFTLHRTLRP